MRRRPIPSFWSRLGIALAVVAILYLRLRIVLRNPEFWAEDGTVFFSGVMTDPRHGLSVVFVPYAGYLLLLPRLLAVGASVLPIAIAPAAYAWAAILGTGVVAWAIQSPRIRLPGGAIAALAIAAVPHTGEVYGKICNLQWIMALLLFGILIADDPKSWAEGWTDLAALVLTGLTGPFVILAVPLFALRAWQRRSAASGFLLGAASMCALIQAWVLTGDQPPANFAPWDFWHVFPVVGRRLFVSQLLGGVRPFPLVSGVLGAAIPATLAAFLWRDRKVLPGGAMLFLAAALIIGASAFRVRFDQFAYNDLINGDRYFFSAKVIVVWLLAALALTRSPRAQFGLAAVLALALMMNRAAFVYPAFPDLGWREYSAVLKLGKPVRVPVLPQGISFYYPGAEISR